jgi:tellurite resistance protein TerB
MLGFLKEKLGGGAKRMTGKTDMLEAACATCALVGAADGDFSDDEAAVSLERLTTHEALSGAFSTSQIEAAFDKQVKRIKQGMSGRIGLRREVEEARTKGKATRDDLEMLFCIAIDVANADGSIEPAEMKVLRDIGTLLGGFDPAKYLA